MAKVPRGTSRSRGIYQSEWGKGSTAQVSKVLGGNKLKTPAFRGAKKPAEAKSETGITKALGKPAKLINASYGSTGAIDFGVDGKKKST